jgi:hypothetical protein
VTRSRVGSVRVRHGGVQVVVVDDDSVHTDDISLSLLLYD